MKKNILYFIIAALILANFFTLSKLNRLENSIINQNNQSQAIERNLRNKIDNIYSRVEAMLEKEASILDNYDVKFGEFNTKDLTVPMTLNITPKEYSDELIAKLQLNNEVVIMKNSGTIFTVTKDVNIFNPIDVKVILEVNDIKKLETLNINSNLQHKYLLGVSGGFSGESSYGSKKYKYKGSIELDIRETENNKALEVMIVKELNGKIIDEEKVAAIRHKVIPVSGELDINANDTLIIYAKVKDSYGLTYKRILKSHQVGENGKPIDGIDIRNELRGFMEIRDSEDNLLYEGHY